MKKEIIHNQTAERKTLEESVKPKKSKSAPILDDVDRHILQIIQDDFPLVQKPWQEISSRLSISESEVMARLRRLSEEGVIRKIGPIIENSKIGLNASTLVAVKVQKDRVDQVSCIINQFDNVSHNYEREDEYNVWFTLVASSKSRLTEILDEIKRKTGVEEQDMLSLPTVRRFKINVCFQLTEQTSGEKNG